MQDIRKEMMKAAALAMTLATVPPPQPERGQTGKSMASKFATDDPRNKLERRRAAGKPLFRV